jgi:hypothetical protein
MLAKPYPWSAVLMPLNVMDAHYRSFQKEVLPKLNEQGIAALGMKSLGGNGSIVTKAGMIPPVTCPEPAEGVGMTCSSS